MFGTSLKALVLAASIFSLTGCYYWNGHHPFARNCRPCPPCDPCCATAALSPGFDGPALVPSDGLFTQPPPPIPIQPQPPFKGQPPRVVPVPQANPMPYTP